jgi:hypothetical protein
MERVIEGELWTLVKERRVLGVEGRQPRRVNGGRRGGFCGASWRLSVEGERLGWVWIGGGDVVEVEVWVLLFENWVDECDGREVVELPFFVYERGCLLETWGRVVESTFFVEDKISDLVPNIPVKLGEIDFVPEDETFEPVLITVRLLGDEVSLLEDVISFIEEEIDLLTKDESWGLVLGRSLDEDEKTRLGVVFLLGEEDLEIALATSLLDEGETFGLAWNEWLLESEDAEVEGDFLIEDEVFELVVEVSLLEDEDINVKLDFLLEDEICELKPPVSLAEDNDRLFVVVVKCLVDDEDSSFDVIVFGCFVDGIEGVDAGVNVDFDFGMRERTTLLEDVDAAMLAVLELWDNVDLRLDFDFNVSPALDCDELLEDHDAAKLKPLELWDDFELRADVIFDVCTALEYEKLLEDDDLNVLELFTLREDVRLEAGVDFEVNTALECAELKELKEAVAVELFVLWKEVELSADDFGVECEELVETSDTVDVATSTPSV